MLGKERQRRSTAPEMAQLRRLCRERLFAEWRSAGTLPGASLPGVRLLSDRYQLPLSVIRTVLSELKAEGVIAGEPRAAMTLQRLPLAPKTIAGRRIALISKMESSHPYARENTNIAIWQGMERLLNEQGGTLEFLNTWSPGGNSLGGLNPGTFDAILVQHEDDSLIAKLASVGIPVVRIDDDSSCCHSVMFDDFDCGRKAMEHLLDLGHTRIAVAHYPEFEWSRERLSAARTLCAERGAAEPLVWEFPYLPNLIMVAEVLDRYLGDRTAIFAANDRLASMIATMLEERGHRIPVDISLVGCDDLPVLRSRNLTTVQRSYTELSLAAYELLKEELLNPPASPAFRKIRLKCPLLVRSSSQQKEK